MNLFDTKHIKAAKKYAGALFQSAVEIDKTEKVYDDLVFISETIETNEELKNVLLNPTIKVSDKKDIVKKLFELHTEKISLDFIYLLLENGRLNCITCVIDFFIKLQNKRNNVITPIITSATELSEEQKNTIISKLECKTKKVVKPLYSIDEGIIGGLIVKIEDKTIDCSIAAKFENMKRQLTKGKKYGND